MDLSSFSENIKLKNVSLFAFIIFGAVTISIIIFLSTLTIRLTKKVNELSKVRYGFGGKPIFSLLVVLGVTIAIPLTLYASQKSIESIKLARAERDVIIELNKTKKSDNMYTISFMAVPTIAGEAWSNKVYSITWIIEGKVNFEKIEKDKTLQNTSYFKKDLPIGSYKIKVLVESENFRVIKYEEMILE